MRINNLIPENTEGVGGENITEIGFMAFRGCSALTGYL